jgi:hypothetical protein
LSPGVKPPEREAHLSLPLDDEVKNTWNVIKYRDNVVILLKALKKD